MKKAMDILQPALQVSSHLRYSPRGFRGDEIRQRFRLHHLAETGVENAQVNDDDEAQYPSDSNAYAERLVQPLDPLGQGAVDLRGHLDFPLQIAVAVLFFRHLVPPCTFLP